MSDSTVPLAAIGLVGTILALVVTPLFGLLNKNTKAQDENTEALKALVIETKDGNDKAEVRNGHLGEQNVQIAELVTNQNKDVSEILSTLKTSATALTSDTKKAADAAREVANVLKDSKE